MTCCAATGTLGSRAFTLGSELCACGVDRVLYLCPMCFSEVIVGFGGRYAFVVCIFLVGNKSANNFADLSAGLENLSGIFVHNLMTSSNFLAICCDVVSGVRAIL